MVFEAFTTDGGQEAFYVQDDPGWIVESDCDLRVGGVWTVTFGPARSHLYGHRHVFEVVDRPWRLVLATMESRPDGSSLDFAIEFTFEARDGKTLMTMTQSGFPTAELPDEHGRGVPNAFARLERAIHARKRDAMSATVLDMSMSLDGFITGPEDDHDNGLGLNGHRLHDWLSDGADPASHRPSGVSGEVFDELMATGAVVVGRRTFELRSSSSPESSTPPASPTSATASAAERASAPPSEGCRRASGSEA